MTLHFDLKVNRHSIAYSMEISRVRPHRNVGPDMLGTYEYVAYDTDDPGARPCGSGVIVHRYGDGAWELVRKAVNHMLGDDTGVDEDQEVDQ